MRMVKVSWVFSFIGNKILGRFLRYYCGLGIKSSFFFLVEVEVLGFREKLGLVGL